MFESIELLFFQFFYLVVQLLILFSEVVEFMTIEGDLGIRITIDGKRDEWTSRR